MHITIIDLLLEDISQTLRSTKTSSAESNPCLQSQRTYVFGLEMIRSGAGSYLLKSLNAHIKPCNINIKDLESGLLVT